MPKLETVYPLELYETVAQLKDWMIRANAYGFVTKNQGKAIVQKLTPMLPVNVSLTSRTNKGIIYLDADGYLFRVNQRAQVVDKPWNPKPRQPAKNPWAD